jgi:hypothetical protein
VDPYGILFWDANTKIELRELEGGGTTWILTTYPVGMLILKLNSENSREVALRGFLRHTPLGC